MTVPPNLRQRRAALFQIHFQNCGIAVGVNQGFHRDTVSRLHGIANKRFDLPSRKGHRWDEDEPHRPQNRFSNDETPPQLPPIKESYAFG